MSDAKSYKQLSEELDKIIAWFESDEVDLEHAISNYEKAEKLITEMENYLKNAENKIKKIIKDSDA